MDDTKSKLIQDLKNKLKEIFQFDNNDLDFGIYRIINIKRKEIGEFIDKELFEVIKEKIKTVEENSELQKSLESLKKDIETSFGCDINEAKKKYAETPKVKDLVDKEKELKLADKESDIEEEIYDDIINFFSRYYDKGDFISKRRYSKDSKYAIPYNGEEVYLYWANNDQYYIKTAENFKLYSFKANSLKVNFEIVSEDVKVEKGNIKDAEKKFFVYSDAEYDSGKRILTIKFGYRGLTEDEEEAVKKESEKVRIGKDEVNVYNLKNIQEKIGIWGLEELKKKHIKMDGDPSDRTELEWHLNKYTTKNTSDYFIHKNLKKFLGQELDFYIKNELLHIDDIESKDDLNINLKRIKVFKDISLKIIEFLAQIEEFQKKIWEKKKFVISTDYCITLDYIDKKYYPEILKNKAQLEEWKKIYSFDVEEQAKKLTGTLKGHGNGDKKVEVLKQNPTLVIDTQFYDINFKYQILSEIDDLDEKTNGILINSENFQALSLLQNKYYESIKCCYIDPPYNTSEASFLYKNSYRDSSWIQMISDRMKISKTMLEPSGIIGTCIDDFESANLEKLKEGLFSRDDYVGTLVIEINPRGRTTDTFFATCHDYVVYYCKDRSKAKICDLDLTEDQASAFNLKDEISHYRLLPFRRSGGLSTPEERPNSHYPIYYNETNGKIDIKNFQGSEKIIPKDTSGKLRVWRQTKPSLMKAVEMGDIVIKKNQAGYSVFMKDRIKKGRKPKTIWSKPIYDASSHGTILIKNLFGDRQLFTYPKSIFATMDSIRVVVKEDKFSSIIDYFAGSGTTGHAVLKLNKEDKGNRKFILVEMGQYFDTVTKPRMQKVIYSDNWKDGKPQDNNGSKKQIIKYQSLEQYEDSLNNIDFKRASQLASDSKDYKIKYMLEFEAKGSNVLLNLDALENPFEYKIKVENNNEVKEHNIDLIETFNYIAGVDVKNIRRIADKKRDYIVVTGQRDEKEIVVIWRDKSNGFDPKKDKEFIEKEILKEEYDEVYVNGNSLIPEAKSVDEVLSSNMFRA